MLRAILWLDACLLPTGERETDPVEYQFVADAAKTIDSVLDRFSFTLHAAVVIEVIPHFSPVVVWHHASDFPAERPRQKLLPRDRKQCVRAKLFSANAQCNQDCRATRPGIAERRRVFSAREVCVTRTAQIQNRCGWMSILRLSILPRAAENYKPTGWRASKPPAGTRSAACQPGAHLSCAVR